MIHDGMPYNPIQGPGHVGLKVAKMPTSKSRPISSLRRYARNQKTNGKLWYLRDNIQILAGQIFDIRPHSALRDQFKLRVFHIRQTNFASYK